MDADELARTAAALVAAIADASARAKEIGIDSEFPGDRSSFTRDARFAGRSDGRQRTIAHRIVVRFERDG